MDSLVQKTLDKREERIRRMFGQIAPWYDFLNHVLSLNVDRRWRAQLTRRVPAYVGAGPMLDVCTGTGDLALAYDRACPGEIPIVAADFCREMLLRAAEKAVAAGAASRIHFVEADAQALPFASDTFQLVVVAFGLRNVTDPERGLAEMVRVARPGGRVAILEFSKPRHWLFGRLYRWYFRYILPLVGQLLSRSRESAYRYLPESVMQFPDNEELADRLRAQGLQDVTFEPLTFGIATVYVGVKRQETDVRGHESSVRGTGVRCQATGDWSLSSRT
jgi:demethylmenaquinone methyltransferase/2-methoxy-6-polyprenyl-1,4-benzoquinol methylase